MRQFIRKTLQNKVSLRWSTATDGILIQQDYIKILWLVATDRYSNSARLYPNSLRWLQRIGL